VPRAIEPPSVGLFIDTVGAIPSFAITLSMLMLTSAELPWLLLASVAITRRVCEPSEYAEVSRLKLYGEDVSVAFSSPSTYNFTLETPTASLADAETVIVPDTVAPLAGVLIEVVGAVVSLTVTVNEPLAVLPLVSETEQLTVVVPSGNVEPEAGVQLTVREPSTRSVAVAVNDTTLPAALVASTVMFGGSVNVGAVVSLTVTVNDAVPVLPAESVAEQFTVVVVIGKVEPEDGVQTAAIGPSTSSVAVTAKLTEAPDGPVASTVIGEGTVSTGGVVSDTGGEVIVMLTAPEAGDMLPALSLAFALIV
jgi:hypothetical protein